MPPTIPYTPNPIREALPSGIRKVVEFFFPEKDVFGGLGVGPLTMVDGPPDTLLKALHPLSGSIPKGQQLAAELTDRIPPSTPATNFVSWLDGQLKKHASEPLDVGKHLAKDQVTGSRPPIPATIESSYAGMAFRNPHYAPGSYSGHPTVGALAAAQDPRLDAIRQLWDRSTVQRGPKSAMQPRSSHMVQNGERPPLSGRWQTGTGAKNALAQNRLLAKKETKRPGHK